MSSELAFTIKKNLKHLRKQKHITQREAAQIFGISYSAYGKYENNTPVQPTLEILIRIADYYGVSLDELIDRDHKRTENDAQQKQTSIFDKFQESYESMSLPDKMVVDKFLEEAFAKWRASEPSASEESEQEEQEGSV